MKRYRLSTEKYELEAATAKVSGLQDIGEPDEEIASLSVTDKDTEKVTETLVYGSVEDLSNSIGEKL